MMRRRKAETLVEFLMALFVFGVIMGGVAKERGGIIDFIANQTTTLVNIRNRDTMMFHAQRFRNMNVSTSAYNADSVCQKDNVNISIDGDIMTVSRGKSTMTFNIKP